jgi:hypothetical protein
VDNPQKSLSSVDIDLECFINGKLLSDTPIIELEYQLGKMGLMSKGGSSPLAEMKIGLHNRTNKFISPDLYSIALIMPSWFEVEGGSYHPLGDENYIWNFQQRSPLFPDGWSFFDIQLMVNRDSIQNFSSASVLRLFTAVGPKDFSFTLRP